jgi:hypothetical protein
LLITTRKALSITVTATHHLYAAQSGAISTRRGGEDVARWAAGAEVGCRVKVCGGSWSWRWNGTRTTLLFPKHPTQGVQIDIAAAEDHHNFLAF